MAGNLIDTDLLEQFGSEIPNFTGATSSTNGKKGFVPAPAIADKDKFLKGDGSFSSIPSDSSKRTAGSFDDALDVVTFTSSDVSSDSSATSWTTVSRLTSGSTFATLLARISQMFKNIRYLYNYRNDYKSKKITSNVSYSSVSFTDSTITDSVVIDGPYIKDSAVMYKSVSFSGTTVTYTLSDSTANGKTAYIWTRY